MAGRAEARLRDLHPDAMTRHDQLRAGLSPVEAMREVVPLIVVEQQHAAVGEPLGPMLEPAVAASANSSQALAAWSAALPLADTVHNAAAAAAETRLRELHPDAMSRYDALRETHTPTTALDEVGPLIDPTVSASHRRLVDDGDATAAQRPKATQPPEDRYARVVREVLQAELADQVLHDQVWLALAGALAAAEQLGARPPDLLAAGAGERERELASAKSVAEVLTLRVEQHQLPTQVGPPRIPTDADLAANQLPDAARGRPRRQPPAAGPRRARRRARARPGGRHRAANRPCLCRHADDVSAPHVDERREGLNDARTRVGTPAPTRPGPPGCSGRPTPARQAQPAARPSPPPPRRATPCQSKR